MPDPAGTSDASKPGDSTSGTEESGEAGADAASDPGEAGAGTAAGETGSGSEPTAGTTGSGGPPGSNQTTGGPGGTGTESTPSQDTGNGSPGASGDDGWVTSNEIPGVGGRDMPAMPSSSGPGNGSGADAVLDKALEGLDGEILSERAVIRSRSNETAASNGSQTTGGAGAGTSNDPAVKGAGGAPSGSATTPRMPGVPSNRNSPPGAPAVAAGPVPEDIPVAAQDDDIVARQLREAAMKETDPELREKLWAEYRRYKGM